MIKIDFSFSSQHGTFSDALHLPDDHAFTDTEIEAMKQARFDNWIAVITAPPNYVLDADGNISFDADGAAAAAAAAASADGNPVIAE